MDPAEAALVAAMFAWYLAVGATFSGLGQHLQHQGVSTLRGGTLWNPASVRGMLSIPGRYLAGVCSLDRRIRVGLPSNPWGRSGESSASAPREEWIAVPQLPHRPPEPFDRVQAKLARNRGFASRNSTGEDYLLRGLVSCGGCQLGWRCWARYTPATALDTRVWHDLCQILSHPEMIACALERTRGGPWLPQEFQARRENLRRGRTRLQPQIERLTDAYLSEVIPLAQLQRRLCRRIPKRVQFALIAEMSKTLLKRL